ncbi:GntR family transcriptional regulator [Synergistales bacterium]|nr:GntR family transcriptional regulator [Synergistales bacterium]
MKTTALYRPSPLRKQVYDHLRELLISDRLKPGDFINQAELIANLGVSRTPLRESLMQLEAEGFVSIIPCRGVRINPLTLDGIRHIYQISGALESAALEAIFPLMRKERLDILTEITRRTEVLMKNGNFSACHENDVTFHETVLELCDNEELLKMLRRSRERLYHFSDIGAHNLSETRPDLAIWEREYWAQHRKIISIFQNGAAREIADYVRYVHWDFDGVKAQITAFYQLTN